MAGFLKEFEGILEARRKASTSKCVAIDVNGDTATYQPNSELQTPRLPWWAVEYLRAGGIKIKPDVSPAIPYPEE